MAESAPQKPTILIAEDDRRLCELMELWLSDDYELVMAHDGEEALTRAHEQPLAAAVVDIMMPRLSGLGLQWAFTHHPRLKHIPTIFVTAHPEAVSSGLDPARVLHKPFRRAELRERLAEVVVEAQPIDSTEPARFSERRRMPRVDVDLPARLIWGERTESGRVQAISLLGAFFQSETHPPVDRDCVLSLTAGGVSFKLPAQVVHVVTEGDAPGVGLSLHDLGLDTERRFLRLLVQLQEGP